MSEGEGLLNEVERRIYAAGTIVGAVVVAGGAFQPWVPRGGAGVDYVLGVAVLVASVLIAVLAVRFLMGSGSSKDMCGVAGVVSVAVIFAGARLIWEVLDSGDADDIGSGLYLLVIGGFLCAVCSITGLLRAMGEGSGGES